MEIKPIKSKKDHEAALERIDALMDADKNTKEGDELEVLSTLVEAYEEEHFPIDNPDPIEAIKHCMEALGMDQKDLIPILGGKNRVSEIMNKRRALTMDMVRSLNKKMGIPAQMLIKPYPLKRSAVARRKTQARAA